MPRPVPFRITLPTIRPDRGPDVVEAEIRAQMLRLGVERVDTLMATSASDLVGAPGLALWSRLQSLRDQGLCQKIGVSVFASDDRLISPTRFHNSVHNAPSGYWSIAARSTRP
mgnify:CR=1 FL=1